MASKSQFMAQGSQNSSANVQVFGATLLGSFLSLMTLAGNTPLSSQSTPSINLNMRFADQPYHRHEPTIIYQVYTKSFKDGAKDDGIGDFRGVIQRIPYLKKLGINAIWLSPFCDSPDTDGGYDIRDYYKVMDKYGSMDDLKELIQKAHENGIKVIMDMVVNHTSIEHHWFKEHPDYYIWRDPSPGGGAPNNWRSFFGGSAWTFDKSRGQYYLHLFAKTQPDLDWTNPALRREIYKVMRFWLDKGIDGFRMDAIQHIAKADTAENADYENNPNRIPQYAGRPEVHAYLKEMHREVFAHYSSDLILIGETTGATAEDALLYAMPERNELNAVITLEHLDLDIDPKNFWRRSPWRLSKLKAIISNWQSMMHQKANQILYWQSHDIPRVLSRYGDTSNELYRVLSAKMLATVMYLLEGMPIIYQGEELGMTNLTSHDPEDYPDIATQNYIKEARAKGLNEEEIALGFERARDNARSPFPQDASSNAGFTKSNPWMRLNPNYLTINAQNALKDPNSVFYYYRNLIELRKKFPVITQGTYELLLPKDEQIFAYIRKLGDQKLLVITNFTSEPANFQVPNSLDYDRFQLLLSNYEVDPKSSPDMFTLQAYEARVYLLTT
ncbi:MAG: alpha-glucosidase [Candidatus Caenarcaniphilales bacterium]|nr:alpha-glucosidase [Candidatus Caenarcaniphilales bacterium]